MISWNGRAYDFLEVLDYEKGKRPRLVKADKQVCFTCHQNEAPIFSRFPWSETDKGNDKIREKISLERKKVNVDTDDIDRNSSVVSFDQRIRNANRSLQASRVCSSLCGENKECKRYLLLIGALGNRPSLSEDLLSGWSTQLSKLVSKESYPEDGFSYPSSVLPDRDPLRKATDGGGNVIFRVTDEKIAFDLKKNGVPTAQKPGLTDFQEPTFSENLSTTDLSPMRGVKEVRMDAIDGKSRGNPATPRPKVNKIQKDKLAAKLAPFLGEACFGFTDQDQELLSKVSIDRLQDIILKAPEIDSLLELWPQGREKIMPVLQKIWTDEYLKEERFSKCDDGKASIQNTQKDLIPEISRIQNYISNFFGFSSTEENSKKNEQDPTKIKSYFKKCIQCHSILSDINNCARLRVDFVPKQGRRVKKPKASPLWDVEDFFTSLTKLQAKRYRKMRNYLCH